MNRLIEIFEEPNGGLSSTRVVLIMWFSMLTFVYGWTTLTTGKLPEIPYDVVALSACLLTGKWLQRKEESTKESV